MTNSKFIKIFFFCLFIPGICYADSPLTSTPISNAYEDLEIVKKAKASGEMNSEFALFLHNESNPIDKKAALINALGWDFNGKKNAMLYCNIIFGKQINEKDIASVSAEDNFVIGYLKALDDYFYPYKAVPYLKAAQKKMDDSYTVFIILALVRAQNADFCSSWRYVNKVFRNKDLEKDLRKEAVKIIYDYMVLYKNDCN